MQAQYYTDKSIAIFGNTRPWTENLKALGGRFNRNLTGGPGWIFGRAKEQEILQFLTQVEQGTIQPFTKVTMTTVSFPSSQVVPFGTTMPAMTPQNTMSGIPAQQIQPLVNTPQIPRPSVAIPPFNTRVPLLPSVAIPPLNPRVPQPLSPKPTTILQQRPLSVDFPNLFTAADGLTYQIIIYTAPIPEIGQHVILTIGDQNTEFSVTSIQKNTMPIDDITITQIQIEGNEPPSPLRAIIMNGKWKIEGIHDEHILTFRPKQ